MRRHLCRGLRCTGLPSPSFLSGIVGRNTRITGTNEVRKTYLFPIIIFLTGAIAVSPIIFQNAKNLSIAILTGDETPLTPKPYHGFLHLPQSDNPERKNMTFAADFAAIYYTARHFNEPDIYAGKYDPAGRHILYSPSTYYFYQKTFCRLPYGQAALAHLSFQLILLFAATFFLLGRIKRLFLLIPVTVIYGILIFLTPVGLSWFERGQTDLYAACALMFLIFSFYESKGYAWILAALCLSLKYTIIIFVAEFIFIYLLFSSDRMKWRNFFLFLGGFFLTLILFPPQFLPFVWSMYETQNFHFQGMTLVGRVSREILFVIAGASLGLYLGLAGLQRKKEIFVRQTLLPYGTGLIVLNLLFLSFNYQYRIMTLIGFIPLFILWYFRWNQKGKLSLFFILIFTVFLIFSFHVPGIFNPSYPSDGYFVLVYIIYAAVIAIVTVVEAMRGLLKKGAYG